MISENNKKKSRREFLIASAALAGGFISLTLLKPFSALGDDADKVDIKEGAAGSGADALTKKDYWYGFGFDIEKCIGCGKCADACKKENNVSTEPFYFRTWVEQYTVKIDGTVKIESPNGGIDGFKQSVPEEEILRSYFVPKACNHCADSPCVDVCPTGASFISPEGVVLADLKYCIGCAYCVQACPYGCRYIDPKTQMVDKCTLCYHRITKGLSPACVEVCPTGARIYGNLHDKKSALVAFINSHNCWVLKPYLNTKPKLFYNDLREEVR